MNDPISHGIITMKVINKILFCLLRKKFNGAVLKKLLVDAKPINAKINVPNIDAMILSTVEKYNQLRA